VAESEKQIQDTVLELLQHHPKVAWAHRMNVGATKIGNRFIRFGAPGMADITGQLKNGRRLEIEMKRPGKHATDAQAAFISKVNKHGGLAFVAHSCIEVLEALAQV
jgi:hypothetical protein